MLKRGETIKRANRWIEDKEIHQIAELRPSLILWPQYLESPAPLSLFTLFALNLKPFLEIHVYPELVYPQCYLLHLLFWKFLPVHCLTVMPFSVIQHIKDIDLASAI